MHFIDWRNIDLLPEHNANNWAFIKDNCTVRTDHDEIQALTRKWQPQIPLIVAEPGANRFTPPVYIEALKETSMRSTKSRLIILIYSFLVAAIAFTLLSAFYDIRIFSWGISSALMAVIFIYDYYKSLRYEAYVKERALFFYWFYNSKIVQHNAFFYALSGALIGTTQYLLQNKLGNLEATLHAYGVMYDKINSGEFWRLLSGPFIHNSTHHFAINFVLFIFIGTLSSIMFKRYISILVFLIGNASGALVQSQWGEQLFNSYCGISAGIYALFGAVIAYAVQKKILPHGLIASISGVAVIGILDAQLTSKTAATTAHIAGFLIGILIVLIPQIVKSIRIYRSTTH